MLVMTASVTNIKEKLGFTKDVTISVTRIVIQLVTVGYLLKRVFQVSNLTLTLIMVLMVISNTTFNARRRSQRLRRGFLAPFIVTGRSTGIAIGILIFSGPIRSVPSQIAPINGVITSNSMVAIDLCYCSLDTLSQNQR